MSLLSEVTGTVVQSNNLRAQNLIVENIEANFIEANTILKSTAYFTTATNITRSSAYANTYNGATLTVNLFTVDATNVGLSYLITNINATNLTVGATGGQTIYSSTGAAALTPRVLNQGHSQIFTALQVGASTYGWSMV
jgi:hypothetical protein